MSPEIKVKFMNAPAYDWTCHSCRATNSAGVTHCSSCGLGAYATVKDIEKAQGKSSVPNISKANALALLVLIGWSVLFYVFAPKWAILWLDPRITFFAALLLVVAIFGILRVVWTVARGRDR